MRKTLETRAYILWFEFLKLARDSEDPEIQTAYKTNKSLYREWHIDTAGRFDSWWKDHRHLFEEKSFVRKITHNECDIDRRSLLIEIPLTKSTTELLSDIRIIIEDEFKQKNASKRKMKAKSSAIFSISEGSEPKFDAIQEMLTVYRRIYLKYPKLPSNALLPKVNEYYANRRATKIKKETPFALRTAYASHQDRAERNLRRYIQRARKIILNVANGEFPGKY